MPLDAEHTTFFVKLQNKIVNIKIWLFLANFSIQPFLQKIGQKQSDFDIYYFILLFHKESRMFRI